MRVAVDRSYSRAMFLAIIDSSLHAFPQKRDQCNVRPEAQQYLFFFPLTQGQGALRPIFGCSAALLQWEQVRVFPKAARLVYQ